MSDKHQALYRLWRPKTFDEVVGQRYTVMALKESVIRKDIAHAYLFSGTRGTGKTSLAKIFSRAINCEHPQNGNPDNSCAVCKGILEGSLLDVIEIDAASNNSVEHIRSIVDEVAFLPAKAKYKVYIIDEVHMLSVPAQNALLKTLEEPPAHVIFILATTEPQKILTTILSRCQRYEFKRLSEEEIKSRLLEISENSKIRIDNSALDTIAKYAEGGLRDAISLLDQAKALSASQGPDHQISRTDIQFMAGRVDDKFIIYLLRDIAVSDATKILQKLQKISQEGKDYLSFCLDLANYYRHLLLITALGDKAKGYIPLSNQDFQLLAHLLHLYDSEGLMQLINESYAMQEALKKSRAPQITLEISLLALMGKHQKPNAKEMIKKGAFGKLPAYDQAETVLSNLSTPECIETETFEEDNKSDTPSNARIEEINLSPSEESIPQDLQNLDKSTDERSNPILEVIEEQEALNPNSDFEFNLAEEANIEDEILSSVSQLPLTEDELDSMLLDTADEIREEEKFEASNHIDTPSEMNANSEQKKVFTTISKDNILKIIKQLPNAILKAGAANLSLLLLDRKVKIQGNSIIYNFEKDEKASYNDVTSHQNQMLIKKVLSSLAPTSELKIDFFIEEQEKLDLTQSEKTAQWLSALSDLCQENNIKIIKKEI